MIKLKKSLNLVDVFCIASGAMISSGIFLLPGLAHAQTGSSVIVSYFIAGLLAMTGMLSQAELVSAMPKAGGTYFYVARSFGPAVGTINGLMTWLSLCFKAAFALIGISTFARLILPENFIEQYSHLPIEQLIASLFCIGFAILNIFSIKWRVHCKNI